MPENGYPIMFSNMLSNKKITVALEETFQSIRNRIKAKHIIYTGPIDECFNYCYGALPYRSLRFEHQYLSETNRFQSVGTMNCPMKIPILESQSLSI